MLIIYKYHNRNLNNLNNLNKLGVTKLILIILIIINSLFYVNVYGASEKEYKFYNSQDLNLTNIEIADDNNERMKGLMYRTSLCAECAMLFVFNYPAQGGFWMKDTKISLDIIFMDSQGQIINYHTNTEPLNTNKIYFPKNAYSYVLETNAGFVKKYNLKQGMRIDIKDLMVRGGIESK